MLYTLLADVLCWHLTCVSQSSHSYAACCTARHTAVVPVYMQATCCTRTSESYVLIAGSWYFDLFDCCTRRPVMSSVRASEIQKRRTIPAKIPRNFSG